MSDSNEMHDISTQGEAFSTVYSYTWINPGPIETGEALVPARLNSQAARAFAALHLILGDLAFAEDCLKAANDIGIPDDKNYHSKALIFSGVVGYARSFKSGVRELTLNPADLHGKGAPFDGEIHEYIIALRDKHIAHSVNDFERCESIAIVVGKPGGEWRDASAVGVAMKQSIGISKVRIQRAVEHINALRGFLEADLASQRVVLHDEFRANFDQTGKWDMAPIPIFSDRSKISERRR